MSKVTIDDVKKLAKLSALQVTDEEATKLQTELETILGYVEQLDAVDVEGVEPTYQVTGLQNVMREDRVIDYGVSQQQLLQNTPEQQDAQIKVRKVL
ncbi:Asp-tRNA(Asn)/Glu-tRNA(Gln) amidotransferase GatCAB subunit C [Candidatus Saccharibacteria bacterium]|nr:MAG: Asp-tRNA(Asn)/Glu-tRNA(Gln) amidotransferase GatCAB subunit C [Candidatus Saccharibacteria bacterium]